MDGAARSSSKDDDRAKVLRLADAGDAKAAWITLLTTEHYNLQTQRAATIAEANGRASIFLGAVSAGLIALGFQGAGSARSAGTSVFDVVVLTSLSLLGLLTFLRCLEISLDDWQFSRRVRRLRAVYEQLVPDLAELLQVASGAEQASAMLTERRQRYQMMLSVAGTVGVVSGVLIGADTGVLIYGLHFSIAVALPVGICVGGLLIDLSMRFQRARWAAVAPSGSEFRLG